MSQANPFPGPRAFRFEEDEKKRKPFYGRSRETVVLVGLTETRQASLLYSPSGAGKSSLINAGLLPTLTRKRWVGKGERRRQKQRMRYLGTVRLSGKPLDAKGEPVEDVGSLANVFVYLALTSLAKDAADPDLRTLDFKNGLAKVLDDGDGHGRTPALLVFDQFEELFTHNVECWRQREPFFEQLEETLDQRRDLHVLFSMREEYIAELTPYTGLLPGRLLSRYRLERLKEDRALEAVRGPASDGGREFAPGVAEELVQNLLGGTGRSSSAAGSAPGQYVEPLHLQIVCHQLWRKLDDEEAHDGNGIRVIESDHIEEYGDVDKSLREFYTRALEGIVRDVDLREYVLRDWFDKTNVITETGTRGLVRRGESSTEGLPNEAVDRLRDAYLIRTVKRGKDDWYELAHDRLIEPILEANDDWRRDHLKPVTLAAERWLKAERNPELLWSGQQLDGARAEIEEHEKLEREFVEAGLEARRRREEARRRKQRNRRLLIAATSAVILIVGGLVIQRRQATRRAEEITYFSAIRLAANQVAAGRPSAAATLARAPERLRHWEWSYLEAKSRFQVLPPEAGEAEDAAIWGAALSPAPDRPYVAIATKGEVTVWDAVARTKRATLPACRAEDDGIGIPSVRFSGNGRRLLTVCKDGPTRVWDGESAAGPGPAEPLAETTETLDFSDPKISDDGSRILALDPAEGRLTVWPWPEGPDRRLSPPEGDIGDAEISTALFAGEALVALGDADGTVALWDPTTDRVQVGGRHPASVASLAASSRGGRLASASLTTPSGAPPGARFRTGARDVTNGPGGEVRVWRLTGNGADSALELEQEPLELDAEPSQIAFGAGGERLLTLERSGKLTVWSRVDGLWEEHVSFEVKDVDHKSPLVVSPDPSSPRVLVTSRGRAELWNWEEVKSGWTPGRSQPFRASGAVAPRGQFSPTGERLLLLGLREEVLRIWELTGRRAPVWQPPASERQEVPLAAAATFGGLRYLTKIGDPVEARLWEFGASEPLASFDGYGRNLPNAVALSADGSRLVASSKDRTWVWAARPDGTWERLTGPLTEESEETEGAEWAAISPDGELVATAAGTTATVWEAATGEKRQDLTGHTDLVVFAAFGPDGRRVVTTSEDETARVWDLRSGGRLMLEGHDGPVGFAAFSPDGRRVLTAGDDDGTARLWSLGRSARETAILSGHEGAVRSAAFSADGRRIATGDEDGVVRIWNHEGNELLALPARPGLVSVLFDADDRLVVTSETRVELLGAVP